MRWQIEIPKRKISTTDLKGHKDDIEMTGEKVSMIITYEVDNEGYLSISRKLIYPLFRLQPDCTTSSYILDDDTKPIDFGKEKFIKAEIDGMLTLKCETDDCYINHIFYPSTTFPIAYEKVEISKKKDIDIPHFDKCTRINSILGCEGWIYTDRLATKCDNVITFAYASYFCNQKAPKEKDSYIKRKERINELLNQCDLTTGNDIVDTMFAFAKLRVGEAIFNTRNGKINSPCGVNYYAGIWANDQCEYSTPWYAFTNDKNEKEAAINAMNWFERYMNDVNQPLVSSIISEGTDYWNGSRDRGDSEMYLYGNCRFYLTRGELPDKRHLKMLQWAANYIESQILDTGVVYSDTDELENRLSSGINLSTSSLAYGAFSLYAILQERLNNERLKEKYLKLANNIKESIEKYFGGKVSGYDTYHYHKGCDKIRAWLCLPIFMGIDNRWKETCDAIDKLLWKNSSCLSVEDEEISWDRSALYYIATLFRCHDTKRAWDKLVEISTVRLLGERVPYVVEAYPEYNMRHLSAESALYCRIITDGILNISFDKNGFILNPSLPSNITHLEIKNIYLSKNYYDIIIDNGKLLLNKH